MPKMVEKKSYTPGEWVSPLESFFSQKDGREKKIWKLSLSNKVVVFFRFLHRREINDFAKLVFKRYKFPLYFTFIN